MGDIRLGLVVVVVGHEVLHGVVGEKLLKLRAQLGGQGLVVGQHQRGALHGLDDLGHGKGLAGAGNAQQHLLLQPILDALRQRGDGLRLVAGGLIFGNNLKFRHRLILRFSAVVWSFILSQRGGICNICSTIFRRSRRGAGSAPEYKARSPGLFHSPLRQKSRIRHRHKIAVRHDDVVHQLDADRHQRCPGPLRGIEIVLRRQRDAAGVVVG